MKTEVIKIEPKNINYIPGRMSFSEGFLGPKGNVGFYMIADWDRANEIINHLIKDGRNISHVDMGLDGDWTENSMTVYEDGQFTEYNCYDGSQWAEPIIMVYYTDRPSESYSVWKREEKQN